MAIITVLAAVAIPTFGRQLETARETGDMEIIRSAYNEALTLAILDASDGVMDGKNGNTNFATTLTGGAVTYADSKYTVTLASMEPEAKLAQTRQGWQYINDQLFGITVPAVLGKGQTNATTTISFAFEIVANTGNVKLSDSGITVDKPTA